MLGPTPPVAGWSDLDAYAAVLRAEPPAINIAPLVGHGALRVDVVGRLPRAVVGRRAGDARRPLGDGARAGCVRAVDRPHLRPVDVRDRNRAGRRRCGARPAPPPVRHARPLHRRLRAGADAGADRPEPVHRVRAQFLAHRPHRAVDLGSGAATPAPSSTPPSSTGTTSPSTSTRTTPPRRTSPSTSGVGRTRWGRGDAPSSDRPRRPRPGRRRRGGRVVRRHPVGLGGRAREARPDPALVGRTVAAPAADRGVEPAAAMLDLCEDHRNELQVVLARATRRRGHLPRPPAGDAGFGRFGAATRRRRRRATPTSYGAHARLLGHYAMHLGLLAVEAAVAKERRTGAPHGLADRGGPPAGGRPGRCSTRPRCATGDVRTTGPAADGRASRHRERRPRRRRRRAHRRPRRASCSAQRVAEVAAQLDEAAADLVEHVVRGADVGADTLIAASGCEPPSRMAHATQREPISFSSSSSE